METKTSTEPRLIKWALAGYPPINLNAEVKSVTELIRAYNELRKENDRLKTEIIQNTKSKLI